MLTLELPNQTLSSTDAWPTSMPVARITLARS